MDQLTEIKERIINAIYECKLNVVHASMIEFVDAFSKKLDSENDLNVNKLNSAFEAYKNNDFLRLADIFEFEL